MQDDKDKIFKDKKVLIAEDDERNIFALSGIREEKEIKFSITENGKEALKILAKRPEFDMVLMDIMMPKMDGYKAMKEIRKLKYLSIIALTAEAMKGDTKNVLMPEQ